MQGQNARYGRRLWKEYQLRVVSSLGKALLHLVFIGLLLASESAEKVTMDKTVLYWICGIVIAVNLISIILNSRAAAEIERSLGLDD